MWPKANEPKCLVILKENNQDSKRQKPRGRVSPILNNIKWQKWIRYHEYNEIGKKRKALYPITLQWLRAYTFLVSK